MAFRDEFGGRVFIPAEPNDEIGFVWFSMDFIPSEIMAHRITQGLSGYLVCSMEQYEAMVG